MFRNILHGLVVGLLGMQACSAPEPNTRLDFASGTGLTSGNRRIPAGEVINTSLSARSYSEDTRFRSFKATVSYDSSSSPITFIDSTLAPSANREEFGLFLVFGSRGFAGTEDWTFTLTDDQGKTYQKSYQLRTTSNNATQAINTFSSSFFHRNARENLRFFSTRYGTAFPGYIGQSHDRLKQEMDFAFQKNGDQSVNLLGSNNTTFKTTSLTPVQFTNAAIAKTLVDAYNNAGSAQNNKAVLQRNEVIAFRTGRGEKSGLIYIAAIEKSFDATRQDSVLSRIRYTVKVQR